MTDIPYRIALIVGSGSGVGALAHGFAEAGLKVGPAARNTSYRFARAHRPVAG